MDIMNELLTQTVASLFLNNKVAHMTYFKAASDKPFDLPSGSRSQMRMDGVTNALNESQLIGQQVQWVNSQGKTFLEESLSRLGLDAHKINGKGLNELTVDDLHKEKKAVKNELKQYDITFENMFGRQPCRSDKEPLRPLYMFYRRLKHVITKRAMNAKGGNSTNGTNQRSSSHDPTGKN
jgi:hypothetical protein